MKNKLLIIIALLSIQAVHVSAQDVLKEIVKSSLAVVNDTTQSKDVRKIAVFKYDAMTYLRSKVMQPAKLTGKDVNLDEVNADIKMLNEQALAMNQYVTLFRKRLHDAKKKNRNIVVSLFKQATIDHKLFNDDDTEVTLAYYNRNDYPIQFCLDCDWVKTLAFIRTIDWKDI